MADLKSKLDIIKSKENFFEKVKRFIPGYDGYLNRDNARELDTILRNQLAKKLEQNKTRIKNAVNNLSSNNRLFEARDIDKIDKKNENAIAKLRSAARGYSGAFDIVKIKDEKLELLYEYDSLLFTDIEKIVNEFAQLEDLTIKDSGIKEQVAKISDILDRFILKFDDRENILRTL
ncbi:MAG: hypothetical protein FJ216_04620 [Ignavibacteria bacterium]|nr:hypothetical protein [Ignavibacteria bacterium]